ncbi:hypothetical protein K432DRAFT_313848, partial [Lepidopterella palustris CBS 459.81]
SFADISNLKKDINPILKNKVEGNLRVDYPDVFTTYFRGIPRLYKMAIVVFQNYKDAEAALFQEDVG